MLMYEFVCVCFRVDNHGYKRMHIDEWKLLQYDTNKVKQLWKVLYIISLTKKFTFNLWKVDTCEHVEYRRTAMVVI